VGKRRVNFQRCWLPVSRIGLHRRGVERVNCGPKLLDLGEKGVYSSYTCWSPEVLERRLALMACTPAVLKALTTRSIQLGHAELLSGTPPEKQDGVLTQKVPVTLPKSQLGRYARRLPDGSLVFAASGQTCEKVEPYAFVSVLRPGRRL
jgi:hypothetical protein